MLHFQVDLDIQVGCFDGRMAEPGSDHVQVGPGLQQMHGGAVPPGMRRNRSREQRRARVSSRRNSACDQVAQAVTGKALSSGIHEKGYGIGEPHVPILEGCLDCLDRLRPQRTCSLPLAFAAYAHIVGATKPDMVDVEIDNLLSPGSAVVEQAQ